ncbi:hypothetical protein Tco_0982704 [Tanacetum coccineum]
MRIDELHNFSDGTLNDVRTALDDRLKGIRMKYLPQTNWRQSDRDKAGAMIQIDKQLKTGRIMRSLEKFVGGRPYDVMDPQGLSKDSCFISHGDYTHFYQLSHSELVDIKKNIRVILLTVKMEILLEPTSNKLMVDAPVMRTASAAAKPYQGDSSEFYLITGSIYNDQRGTVVITTVFDEVTKTLSSISVDYH